MNHYENIQLEQTVTQDIIAEILSSDEYTYSKISEEIQLDIRTILRLATGKTKKPKQSTWNRLFKLYCRTCFDNKGRKSDPLD